MSDIPSLQEIADMPLKEGLKAIRENYDPNWGADDTNNGFLVRVSYIETEEKCEEFEVFAQTKEQAFQMVEKKINNSSSGDIDIEDIEVFNNKPKYFICTLGRE